MVVRLHLFRVYRRVAFAVEVVGVESAYSLQGFLIAGVRELRVCALPVPPNTFVSV